MGNTLAKRIQFKGKEPILNPVDSTIQEMAFTGFFLPGDIVDFIEFDTDGNQVSVISDNVTINSIDPNVSVILNASVDTTNVTTGLAFIVPQPIDDAESALDRLYRQAGATLIPVRQNILAQELNAPIGGQTTYEVDDVSFFRAGDAFEVLADEGSQGTGNIVSVDPNADAINNRSEIVIDSVIDALAVTNPKIIILLTAEQMIRRNQERIDGIDTPVENEDKGVGDANTIAFFANNLFVQGSSKLLLDGRRLKRGISGTRASLTQGAANSQLIYTSIIMGLDGNDTEVQVASGAGFTIAVTGNYKNGFTVIINDNGGAATSEELADALNADADVKKLVQVQFGGDGSGVVSAFGPSNLAGGLDDGTGDYAELEQVFENVIVSTGFNLLALHIRANETNRLSSPPEDDEELVVDYRRATENV